MLLTLLLTTFLAAPQSPAPSQRAAETAQDPARERLVEFQQLHTQFARAESEWTDALRTAAADLERRRELQAKPPAKDYWERFQKLADQGEGQALLWLAMHVEVQLSDKPAIAAKKSALFQKLVDEHASDEWALELVQSLAIQRVWMDAKEIERLLNDFAAKTKNRELAAVALSKIVGILSGPSVKGEDRARSASINDRIRKDFPDTAIGRQLAAEEYRSRNLQVGCKAPDFVARDVDGAEFKLADFQGKVVLLDFWGFWCPHCVAMLPHERELAAKHKDDPFAIVGVNSDDDKQSCIRRAKDAGVSWRNALDGSRNGPITAQYQVQAFPTLFLIDAQGLIRKLWIGSPGEQTLDDAVATLIAEAKAAKK